MPAPQTATQCKAVSLAMCQKDDSVSLLLAFANLRVYLETVYDGHFVVDETTVEALRAAQQRS